MSTVVLDIILVFISYVLILCAIFCMISQDARRKALNTCGFHVYIIILF
jgi:olfactory receptor